MIWDVVGQFPHGQKTTEPPKISKNIRSLSRCVYIRVAGCLLQFFWTPESVEALAEQAAWHGPGPDLMAIMATEGPFCVPTTVSIWPGFWLLPISSVKTCQNLTSVALLSPQLCPIFCDGTRSNVFVTYDVFASQSHLFGPRRSPQIFDGRTLSPPAI